MESDTGIGLQRYATLSEGWLAGLRHAREFENLNKQGEAGSVDIEAARGEMLRLQDIIK
jgi:hypothetical protein